MSKIRWFAFAVIIGMLFYTLREKCEASDSFAYDYGVFLSIDGSMVEVLEDYETVVIDAQYFDAQDICRLKEEGHTVISYINIGSVENFRDYYEDYEELFLGTYENWEEEQWVDTGDRHWQQFILEELAPELIEKGIDGFFVDNCDVCYNYRDNRIYDGTIMLLKGLMKYHKTVLINGCDYILSRYEERKGNVTDIMTGINQETVFSSINFDNETFGYQDSEISDYYREYLERYGAMEGVTIYLLEYTQDAAVQKKVEEYCVTNGYYYYISDSIELD